MKMSKAVKKKVRRLKKTVRKTLGTLFLVSALVIAAIPVDGLQASSVDDGIEAYAEGNASVMAPTTAADIPQMLLPGDTNGPTKIYTNATNTVQFAYLQDADKKYGAVLVGYAAGFLQGNSLDLTGTVDAYGQYRINDGGGTSSYVAVGVEGNFLFYRNRHNVIYEGTATEPVDVAHYTSIATNPNFISEVPGSRKTDPDNPNAVIELTVVEEYGGYEPCYSNPDSYNIWSTYDDKDLYYYEPDPDADSTIDRDETKYKKVGTNSERQRIKKASITYISNQYITTDSKGKWVPAGRVGEPAAGEEVETAKLRGIFAGSKGNNIYELKVGEEFKGIGDYAFYRSGLRSITLANGLTYIGQGAFEECRQMTTATLDPSSRLTKLGAYAFKNCVQLTGFILPEGVITIEDSAFEGCQALLEIDLCSGRNANNLKTLGRSVFKNCSSLRSLTFPDGCVDDIYMSSFEGCTSLQFICARGRDTQFPDESGFTYDNFKNQVTEEFYFEGRGDYNKEFTDEPIEQWDSKLHYMTRQNSFAFSYLGYDPDRQDSWFFKQDHYELTLDDESSADAKNTFVVNHSNILERYTPTGNVRNLEIPRKIGPYSVATIDTGVFEDKCNLRKVSIPETVETIKADAFRGCHNLTNVVFESGDITIEPNAFKTQEFRGTHVSDKNICSGAVDKDAATGQPTQKLHFTGPISFNSAPFNYAMSEDGRYNAADQQPSYIIYYSGLPQNLEVQYIAGKSVLTDFPSLSDLSGGKKYTGGVDGNYTYLDKGYAADAQDAIQKYVSSAGGNTSGLTEDQKAMVNAALNVVIPEGVQAVKPGLFKEKEEANKKVADDTTNSLTADGIGMTVTAFSLEKIESGVEVEEEIEVRDPAYPNDPDKTIKITRPVIKETVDSATGEKSYENFGTFAGCEHLTGVTLNNDAAHPVEVGDHAFWECSSLENASMNNVSSLGVRPFAGCSELNYVNFQDSAKYVCDNSIVFELDGTGNKNKVVQCLEGRESKYINLEELTGVTELADEAFMGCENLRRVDLRGSSVTEAPDHAFADTTGMQDILLPNGCMAFGDRVFENSSVTFVSIPYEGSIVMESDSFTGLNEKAAIGCVEGSFMHKWAVKNNYETLPPEAGDKTFTVIFMDYPEGSIVPVEVYRESALEGRYVTPPTPKGMAGMIFRGWNPNTGGQLITSATNPIEVSGDVTYTAIYGTAPPDYNKLAVVFKDHEGNELKTVYVDAGGSVESEAPNAPAREGYTFIGWDRPLTNITSSFETFAQYRAVNGDECVVRYYVDGSLFYQTVVKTGEKAPNISVPGKSVTWVPSLETAITKDTDFTAIYDNNSTDPNDPNNPNNPNNPGDGTGSGNNAGALHTLTVQGGSGSGSYVAGTQVIVTANTPPRGQEFNSWTVSPAATVTTDKNQSSMIITMPSNDVAVIANYKAGNSSSSGSGSSNNANSNRPTGSSGTLGGGTTVVIDKNGLSNTGVVSATVNGSSDNFTIKVTEDASATEAILKALQAEYGSLDNIKYFPMDISLYDSTGTKKITDTTGLSINITLPLPDSLIAYAGNNKVAGVVNDRLDKLSPRFTTINGVACVTFTAEHFSPYVIYVDVTQLSDGTISDNTPQTGDWIHPKWFLSIGLACLSFVMFMMKDNRKAPKKKQRVAV